MKKKILKYGVLALTFILTLISGKIDHDECVEELRAELEAKDNDNTETKEEA